MSHSDFYGSYQRDGLMVHVSICTLHHAENSYVFLRYHMNDRCGKLARHHHHHHKKSKQEKKRIYLRPAYRREWFCHWAADFPSLSSFLFCVSSTTVVEARRDVVDSTFDVQTRPKTTLNYILYMHFFPIASTEV